MISSAVLNMGNLGSKTRSLGQILEKTCVRYRGHNFYLLLWKFGQNVCFDDFLVEFENGSYWIKKLGQWVRS